MKLPTAILIALSLLPSPVDEPTRIERSISLTYKDEKFTGSIKNMECRGALADLFRLAKLKHLVDWDIRGEITADLKDADIDLALQLVTRPIDATFQMQGGTYRIMRRFGDSGDWTPTKIERKYILEGSEKTIYKVDVEHVDVRDLILDLGLVSKKNIQIDEDVVGKVTLDARSLRWDEVLRLIVDQVKATFTQEGNDITVKRKGKPG